MSSSKKTKTSIIIVSKTGSLSECVVETDQETTIDELTTILSKKCGYKNPEGFICYHTWRYKNKNKSKDAGAAGAGAGTSKYIYVDIWSKTNGRAGQENKYELPPPIDEIIFFGNMALVARIDQENAINLTLELWNKIYEKLFGGFEDLSLTVAEDDNEVDELDSIPASQKTANGYLKDGFVVDDEEAGETPRRPKRGGVRGSAGAKPKAKARPKNKKSKSESTESEFVTETDTDSGTPLTSSLESSSSVSSSSSSSSPSPSDSENDIIQPQEPPTPPVNTVVKKPRAVKKQSQPASANGISKSGKKVNGTSATAAAAAAAKPKKQVVEEPPTTLESEPELSEEEYA